MNIDSLIDMAEETPEDTFSIYDLNVGQQVQKATTGNLATITHLSMDEVGLRFGRKAKTFWCSFKHLKRHYNTM